MMKASMLTFGKYDKILKPIIINNAINMMNLFMPLKVSTKMFLHNKSVLSYVTPLGSVWMVFAPYLNMTKIGLRTPAVPAPVVFTSQGMTRNKLSAIFNSFFGEFFSTTTFTEHNVPPNFLVECNTGAQVCQGEFI
jgi:hypothetical protein